MDPYFFKRNVNDTTYGEILRNLALPCVERVYNRYSLVLDGLWWFQDGASFRRLRTVRELLSQKFVLETCGIALHEEHG